MNSLSWLNFKCEPYGHGLRGWGFDVFLWLVTSNSMKVIKHTSRKRSKQFDYLVDVSDGQVVQYVSNDILNSKYVMKQTPMGLPILVLDIHMYIYQFLMLLIFPCLFFISVHNRRHAFRRTQAKCSHKGIRQIHISAFFVLFFFHARTSFFSVIGDIPLGAPRPNALMKGI